MLNDDALIEKYPYAQNKVARFFIKSLLSFFFRFFTKFEIEGLENIPEKGPILVVPNHFDFADSSAVIHLMPRPTEFIAGFNMPHAPAFVRKFPQLYKVYPAHRGTASTVAMRAAKAIMKQDGFLCIFPEAGSWAAVLRPARPGAAFIAVETGARLLPIGIDGTFGMFDKLRNFERPKITIKIGKPFGPLTAEGRGRKRREKLDELGHEIMLKIRDLVPDHLHGVYSDDPALRAEAEKVAAYPWDNRSEQDFEDLDH